MFEKLQGTADDHDDHEQAHTVMIDDDDYEQAPAHTVMISETDTASVHTVIISAAAIASAAAQASASASAHVGSSGQAPASATAVHINSNSNSNDNGKDMHIGSLIGGRHTSSTCPLIVNALESPGRPRIDVPGDATPVPRCGTAPRQQLLGTCCIPGNGATPQQSACYVPAAGTTFPSTK